MKKQVTLFLLACLYALSFNTYAENVTVRFLAPDNWIEVGAHTWGGSNTTWPGEKLQKDENGFYVYSFDNSNTNLMFNNYIEGEGEEKTTAIYQASTSCWTYGNINGNEYQLITTACPPEYVTVRFQAPDDWDEVAVYWWTLSSGNHPDGWPGTALIKNASTGLYTFTYDKNAIPTDANIIFNNNKAGEDPDKKQALDVVLNALTDGTCWEGVPNAGGYIVNSITCPRPTSIVIPGEQEVAIYPNPTTDYVQVTNIEKVEKIMVFNTVGAQINATASGSVIDFTSYPSGIYYLSVLMKDGSKQSKKIIKK